MDAGLTVVHTAAELQAAVAAGARDIEIRSHLNLTSLDRTPTLAPYVEDDPRHGLPAYLMYVDAPTRSIRGNCISPPATENTAVPLKPRQCAVAIGDSMMQFLGGRQWLDNLLFRLQPPTAAGTNLSVVLLELGWNAPRSEADLRAEVPAAEVFFTNITVHGDARAPAQVLTASRGSKALMEDCEFVHVHCETMPFHLQFKASARFSHAVFHDITAAAAVVDLGSGGLVHFHAAIFRKIRVPGDAWVAAAADDGLVIDGFDLTPVNSDVARMPVVVRQRGVDVVCNEYFYVDDELVYDEQYAQFDYDDIADELDLPAEPFLDPGDPWLAELRADLPQHSRNEAMGSAPTSVRPAVWPMVTGAVAVAGSCYDPSAPPGSPPASSRRLVALPHSASEGGPAVASAYARGAVWDGMHVHARPRAAAATVGMLLAAFAAVAMMLVIARRQWVAKRQRHPGKDGGRWLPGHFYAAPAPLSPS